MEGEGGDAQILTHKYLDGGGAAAAAAAALTWGAHLAAVKRSAVAHPLPHLRASAAAAGPAALLNMARGLSLAKLFLPAGLLARWPQQAGLSKSASGTAGPGTCAREISAVAASSMRLYSGTHPVPPIHAAMYRMHTAMLLRSVASVRGPSGTCLEQGRGPEMSVLAGEAGSGRGAGQGGAKDGQGR